jgi:cytochrome bd-type quinol oxidase subunit 2
MKPIDITGISFFAVWMVLGIASWLLMRRAKSAAAKRVLYRKLVFVSAGVFLAFTCVFVAAGFPPQILFMVVPAVALIAFLNIRLTYFCPGCVRMIQNTTSPWSRLEFCPHCGAKLNADTGRQSPNE